MAKRPISVTENLMPELNTKEAAEILGVHVKAVRAYIRAGVFVARNVALPSSGRPGLAVAVGRGIGHAG